MVGRHVSIAPSQDSPQPFLTSFKVLLQIAGPAIGTGNAGVEIKSQGFLNTIFPVTFILQSSAALLICRVLLCTIAPSVSNPPVTVKSGQGIKTFPSILTPQSGVLTLVRIILPKG